MSADIDAAKRALRDRIRQQRAERGPDGATALATQFTEHQVALAKSLDARTVAAYLSTPEEPDTRGFLAWALANDVRVLLPIIRQDGLLDWAEFDGTETPGQWGIMEPAGDVLAPNVIEDADLIIAPASACDTGGNRMGWGRGFYDKLLGSFEHRPPVYAMVYDDELFESVPAAEFDLPVTGAITQSGITSVISE